MKQEKICITKRFTFEAAHMLAGHSGECRNLHGHSYKLEIIVAAEDGLKNGMVIDFSDLKALVQKDILERYDHAFLYWAESKDAGEQEIVAVAKKYGYKVVGLKQRPTAENMLLEMSEQLKKAMSRKELKLIRIKLWETEGSCAEVCFHG